MVRFKHRSLFATLEVVLLLTMLVAMMMALLGLVVAVSSSTLGDLRIGVPLEALRDAVPAGMEIKTAEATVTANTGPGYRLAWWLVGPGSSLLVVVGGYVLYGVLLTVRAGDPFLAANVRRLRLLGALTLGYFVFTVARSFVAAAIQRHLGVDDVRAAVSFAPIVSALVLFALAQVWQRGVDLRDEQQLTV